MRRRVLIPVAASLLALLPGCAGSKTSTPATRTTTAQSQTVNAGSTTTTTAAAGPGALQAEANAAAAGDIPDNQVFLVFLNAHAGYSLKYPEGWAQQGSGNSVVFRDKNNIVRIVVRRAAAPTTATAASDLQRLGVQVQTAPRPFSLTGSRAVKAVYRTESAPNAVTGKRVTLVVDRYYVWRAGRLALVDLGTPQGVDNVDAYRLMIESLRWR
jgi:hypothetical protein